MGHSTRHCPAGAIRAVRSGRPAVRRRRGRRDPRRRPPLGRQRRTPSAHGPGAGVEVPHRRRVARRGDLPRRIGPNIVARLKVLADLLTYRTDTAQEGRIRAATATSRCASARSRRSTASGPPCGCFPARASISVWTISGLPDEVRRRLAVLLGETSGAILATGPAGSGKTTTLYACLRELAAEPDAARSLVSLEDPIEVAVDGVTQAQVNPKVGLDLATGLRFLMRQDPEVILVGEIRDRATAEAAFGASLTGHLLLEYLSRRQRRRGHRPAVGHGHRALRAAQRTAGHPLATARPTTVLVRRKPPTRPRRGWGCRSNGSACRSGARIAEARAIKAASCWPKCSRSSETTWAARSSPGPTRRRWSVWPSSPAWSRDGSAPATRSATAAPARPKSVAFSASGSVGGKW